MEKFEIDLHPLVKDSEAGKYFYRVSVNILKEDNSTGLHITSVEVNSISDKYFLFCYIGHPSFMDNSKYKGEKYKNVHIYLKKKIGNKKYDTVLDTSFKIGFYDGLISHLRANFFTIITSKIAGQERKDKISKLLGNK